MMLNFGETSSNSPHGDASAAALSKLGPRPVASYTASASPSSQQDKAVQLASTLQELPTFLATLFETNSFPYVTVEVEPMLTTTIVDFEVNAKCHSR